MYLSDATVEIKDVALSFVVPNRRLVVKFEQITRFPPLVTLQYRVLQSLKLFKLVIVQKGDGFEWLLYNTEVT